MPADSPHILRYYQTWCVKESRTCSNDENEETYMYTSLSLEEEHKEENSRWRGRESRTETVCL